jgi:hypothetical protein
LAVTLGCAALLSIAPSALAQGGSFSGTVTEFAGKKGPLRGISVKAYFDDGIFAGSATTEANGTYLVKGLVAGVYKVEFSGAGFETQWYREKPSLLAASLVVVMAPVDKPGINAALKAEPAGGPVNTAPPILSGTPAIGQMLSCATGSWTGAQPLTFTYAWLRDGHEIGGAAGHTYVVHAADQGRDLACQVTAANSASRASAISNVLKVAAARSMPAPPPPRPPVPIPTLERVSQSTSRWREGNKLAITSRSKGPPVGTTFTFMLNQPAVVSFAFTQQVGGRKVNGKCIAQTRANRRRPACKRSVTQGTLTFAGHSGSNKVVFQGRLSRSKRLPLGAYAMRITALSPAGQRSAPRSLNFTIVK